MSAYVVASIFILSMAICHVTAKRRGCNPVFWVLMTAIAGPLAIPFAFHCDPKEDA